MPLLALEQGFLSDYKNVMLIEFASNCFFGILHEWLSNQLNYTFIFELKL